MRGLTVGQMAMQTYLIDAFTRYAASAVAANTVLRSLFGGLLPLSGAEDVLGARVRVGEQPAGVPGAGHDSDSGAVFDLWGED